MSTPTSIDESSANVSPIGNVENFDNAVNEVNNVEVNESPINVEDDEVEENPFATKKRKKASKVWDEFKECIHCRNQLGLLKSGTTTQFIRYLKCECNWKYDQAKVRQIYAHMVLVHDLIFSFAENEIFNHFMITVSPNWERINVKYMVATCHFVDYDWKLQKRMLCFRPIVSPHTGVAGLGKKLMSFSVDNASYNDLAVNLLKANLNLNNRNALVLDGKLFHVRRCANILNLLVQDGLGEISDIVCNMHESVKHISKSVSRLTMFSDITKQLNLSNKKPILDVIRWNATYYILQAALDLKDVLPRYQLRDSNYHYLPSEEDWSKVQTVCTFLEEFYYVINKALSRHVEGDNDFMRQMAARMIRKFDKYLRDNNLLISIAAILDPRNKMTLVDFVRSSLYKLYNEYAEAFKAKNDMDTQSQLSAPTTSSSSSVCVGRSRGRAEFDNFIRNVGSFQLIKSELDVYLEEGVHIHNESIDPPFDVLEWWKANYLKFRVLSKMACDVLSIPITTVLYESTAKRVIELHRASLAPATVEALLCGGDWLRVYYGIQRKEKFYKRASK
ncbi:Tam3-transposase (Ac family) protein [Dioscorea alata]|uniref:Tam3-transposase (Ac family) protein n=1 Tax=Dioscorea alata TaxID=55571 RepID=A0ACB7UBZ1_DIOAL|nr:Tam3-transposase (Ac family) protein [Dioscorea alata]